MSHKYDIFLSYRREGGFETAQLLYDRLVARGYRVFFDLETLRSGKFNTKLYEVIEQCEDFVIVLSPGSLDRCRDDDDWVRLELAHALRLKKNIIPLMTRNFSFPSTLPADIQELPTYNGIEASQQYFNEVTEKLETKFLLAKPTKSSSIVRVMRSPLAWIGVTLLLLAIIVIGQQMQRRSTDKAVAYPNTQVEKNTVHEMLGYLTSSLGPINVQYGAYQQALDDCDTYLRAPSQENYENFIARCKHAKGIIQQQTALVQDVSPDLAQSLRTSKVNLGDLKALPSWSKSLEAEYCRSLDFLSSVIVPETVMKPQDQQQIVETYRKIADSGMKTLYYGVCELLAPVDADALVTFRTEVLPSMAGFSAQDLLWTHDPVEAKGKQASSLQEQEALLSDLATLTGDMKIDVRTMQKSLEQQSAKPKSTVASPTVPASAKQSSAPSAAVTAKQKELVAAEARVASKQQEVNDITAQIAELEARREANRARAREKFAPKPDDDAMTLWGKALRFIHLKMPDEAVAALEAYLEKERAGDPNAEVYVASAIRFVRQIDQTGIDYGAIIFGFQPAPDPQLHVGDIIIARNGTPCVNARMYVQLGKDDTSDSVRLTVLRPDQAGQLKPVEITTKREGPLIGVRDMSEKETIEE